MDNSLLVELCEKSHSLDKLRRYLLKSGAVLVASRKMDAIIPSSSEQRKLREIDSSQVSEIVNQDQRPNSMFVLDESPHSRIWKLSLTLSAKKYCQDKGLSLTSLNRLADIYYQQSYNGKIQTQYISTVLAGFLDITSGNAQVILLCSQYDKLRDNSLRSQLIRYTLAKYTNKPTYLMVWNRGVQLRIYRCTKGGIIQ